MTNIFFTRQLGLALDGQTTEANCFDGGASSGSTHGPQALRGCAGAGRPLWQMRRGGA